MTDATAFLRILAPDDVQHAYIEGSPAVLAVLEYLLVQHGAVPDAGGHYALPAALLEAAALYWARRLAALAQLPALP